MTRVEEVGGQVADREACVEAKQSREVAGSVRCSEKELDKIAPAWACI